MKIASAVHDYEVHFESDFGFIDSLKSRENAVFVCDRRVAVLYPQLLNEIPSTRIMLIDAIERNKTLEQVQKVYCFLTPMPEKKKIILVSIGGGIVQDITGFVAQTLYRGIQWVFIPTTFLAQADSCVGSKTSLNFQLFKNIVGGFYPPHQVYICPEFLKTLDDKDYFSGIGEVIKFLLLDDRKTVDIERIELQAAGLYRHEGCLDAIQASLSVKQSYVSQDEFDQGKRNLFNYGHCFGHALEATSQYQVPHGLAVVVGMMIANSVALNRGLISMGFFQRLNDKLFLPTLPIKLKKCFFAHDRIISAIKNDKKRVGENLTMIIPSCDRMNAIKADDILEPEVVGAIENICNILGLQ